MEALKILIHIYFLFVLGSSFPVLGDGVSPFFFLMALLARAMSN